MLVGGTWVQNKISDKLFWSDGIKKMNWEAVDPFRNVIKLELHWVCCSGRCGGGMKVGSSKRSEHATWTTFKKCLQYI